MSQNLVSDIGVCILGLVESQISSLSLFDGFRLRIASSRRGWAAVGRCTCRCILVPVRKHSPPSPPSPPSPSYTPSSTPSTSTPSFSFFSFYSFLLLCVFFTSFYSLSLAPFPSPLFPNLILSPIPFSFFSSFSKCYSSLPSLIYLSFDCIVYFYPK